jgi:hypothetical protein
MQTPVNTGDSVATGQPVPLSIAYPEPDFRIRTEQGRQVIWDQVRKKYVALTVEEWVRQNFLRYLTGVMGYPPLLMSVEKEIRLGELKKRCDIVVYRNSRPWMIVECKAPGTPLSGKALLQLLGYNMSLQVSYLVLTNGERTYAVQCLQTGGRYIERLPSH